MVSMMFRRLLHLSRRDAARVILSTLSLPCLRANAHPGTAASIPPRTPDALSGSAFAESIANLDRPTREHRILHQLLQGNLPDFLRKLAPVRLTHRTLSNREVAATIFVTRDYLAIGSDDDFLRIPMNLHTARIVAGRFQFFLPTRKIVDAIYEQAPQRFTPEPMTPGPQMTSTEYYRRHNELIERQSRSRRFANTELVSGHKKDVVLSNLLNVRPNRIAIYGWHRAVSAPIQPLSTVHSADYADYSHGIRLVSGTALVDGRPTPLQDILRDTRLAAVLSDEGALRVSPDAVPA